jgi:hypothetical protein
MAKLSNNTAAAVVLQSAAGTFDTPTSSDYLNIANFRPQIDGVTVTNEEYTGSVVKNGPDVSGKRFSASFEILLRPPGGADVPAAHAYIPGRILQAAKMTELRTTTAIPAAAEVIAAGSTTTITLGAGATGTADLYKGLAVLLQDLGATAKAQMTAIRAYTAGKVATLVELLSGVPVGKYQIPKQLSYLASIAAADPSLLSMQFWFGGDRWDVRDIIVSGLRFEVPTTTSTQAQYPKIMVSIEGTIDDTATEAAPAITPAGAVPLFRDGDLWVANKAVGATTFTVDLGIRGERPPNPNEVTGDEAPQIVESTRSASMTRQRYTKSVFDVMALADAQAQHCLFAQWGSAAGLMVQIVVPDFRFDQQNPDLGGAFVNEQGNLYIDAYDRSVVVNFSYPGAALS